MAQAKLDGPNTHPLAAAAAVARIESNPSTWLHDDGDRCRCRHCEDFIQLANGDYIALTLVEGAHLDHRKRLLRFCSEGCYREWAGAVNGWDA